MLDWAKAISVRLSLLPLTFFIFALQAETWAELEPLGPRTPYRPSIARNTKDRKRANRNDSYWARRYGCEDPVLSPSSGRGQLPPNEDNGDLGSPQSEGLPASSGYSFVADDAPVEPLAALLL
jgi:hypothetical protein